MPPSPGAMSEIGTRYQTTRSTPCFDNMYCKLASTMSLDLKWRREFHVMTGGDREVGGIVDGDRLLAFFGGKDADADADAGRKTISWPADTVLETLAAHRGAALVHTHPWPYPRGGRFSPPSDLDVAISHDICRDLGGDRAVVQHVVEKFGTWTLVVGPHLVDDGERTEELVANHQFLAQGIARRRAPGAEDHGPLFETPSHFIRAYDREMGRAWGRAAPKLAWTPHHCRRCTR